MRERMTLDDFVNEINYHEKLLQTMLEYKNEEGICVVTQDKLAKRLKKNKPWVSKAIMRLNAEDLCVEKIKDGMYKIHYTNIKEQGVFPKIIELYFENALNPNFKEKGKLITDKYNISKKTLNIFRGYLGMLNS